MFCANKLTSISKLLTRIEIGNFLIAISTTGLMAIGVIPMSLSLLIILAVILLFIGVIGRYVDAVKDDRQRLEKYEQHLDEYSRSGCEDSSSHIFDSDRTNALQSEKYRD